MRDTTSIWRDAARRNPPRRTRAERELIEKPSKHRAKGPKLALP